MSTKIIDDMLHNRKLSDLICLTQSQAISLLKSLISSDDQARIRLPQLLCKCFVVAVLERKEVGRPSIVEITMTVKPSINAAQENSESTDITLVYHVRGMFPEPGSVAPAIPRIHKSNPVPGPQVLYGHGPYSEEEDGDEQLEPEANTTTSAPGSQTEGSPSRITSDHESAAAFENDTPHPELSELGVAGEVGISGNQDLDDQPTESDGRDIGIEEVSDEGADFRGIHMESHDDSGTTMADDEHDHVDEKEEQVVEDGYVAVVRQPTQAPPVQATPVQAPSVQPPVQPPVQDQATFPVSESRGRMRTPAAAMVRTTHKVLHHGVEKPVSMQRASPVARQTIVMTDEEAKRIDVKEPKTKKKVVWRGNSYWG